MTQTQHDPTQYGPAFAALITDPQPMPLGPGTPNHEARDKLAALSVDTAFEGRDVVDRDMAAAAISGVWLLHNFLDDSHTISQDIHTPTGSYWHGIMHRREPDYSNAKYWFRKVGDHPVFGPLGDASADLTGRGNWDPFKFIDECEDAARSGGEMARQCVEAQMIEWWLLFDYSYRNALGD